MQNFIYIFDTAARDRLLEAGFLMLKKDEENSIFIFANDDTERFSALRPEFSYVLSDTLTF